MSNHYATGSLKNPDNCVETLVRGSDLLPGDTILYRRYDTPLETPEEGYPAFICCRIPETDFVGRPTEYCQVSHANGSRYAFTIFNAAEYIRLDPIRPKPLITHTPAGGIKLQRQTKHQGASFSQRNVSDDLPSFDEDPFAPVPVLDEDPFAPTTTPHTVRLRTRR